MTGEEGARRHILTVVLEDYFQVGAFSHVIPHGYWSRFETNLQRDAETVLAMLAEAGCRATFFTCGWIADNHPAILRQIVDAGHEVACQGYFHHAIGELARAEFLIDLRRARRAVEDATGQAVLGFRIGRGWIGPDDRWALEALAEAGFAYDSSYCAAAGARAGAVVHRIGSGERALWEVPPTALPVLGRPLLLAGGNYLRQLPEGSMRRRIDEWVSGHDDPLVMYFHSWEMEAEQPRIAAATLLQRLRHYRNLEAMPARIRGYLARYDFTSVADYLELAPAAVEQRRAATAPRESVSAVVAARTAANPQDRVRLSLVIPCFNEAETLPYLEKTLQRFAAQGVAVFDPDYVLVDDGSSDDTWRLLQEYFRDDPRFTLIRHDRNQGIAAALITGFRHASGDFVAALDADCTFAPEQLFEMMALMTRDVDVVVASPAHAQGAMLAVPAWRSSLSKGAAFLHRCVFRSKLTSYTSCFRLYRRRVLQDITVYDPGFCGVTEILGRLDLAGRRIVEFPAVLETRLLGRSKIKVVRTMLGHLALAFRLARLRWLGRPLPAPTSEMTISYADNERK